MLPDVGLTEMMVIAAVALIVVGPKDLPMLLRRLGQFMARVRGMAAEFRASFDEMARQSELDELRKEVEAMRAARPQDLIAQANADDQAHSVFNDIQASLEGTGAQLHPPMAHQYPSSFETAAAEAADAPAPEPELPAETPIPPKKPRAPRKPKAAT